MSVEQRRAATEHHQHAIASINEMFDRLDELAAARIRLTGVAPLGAGGDPVRDAEVLLEHAEALAQALERLRSAALVAAEHRRRADLADDIGTKPTALFPRSPDMVPADKPVRLSEVSVEVVADRLERDAS